MQGSSPIAAFTLHKDPWLQLLCDYDEGYILMQYPMHAKKRERKSHRAELQDELIASRFMKAEIKDLIETLSITCTVWPNFRDANRDK